MTPEEKLCSRMWRLRNSAWVLFSILSVGYLNWAGFLFVGMKSRNKTWLIWAAGFGVIAIGLFVATGSINVGTKTAPIHSLAGDILEWTMFANWVGGAVYSFVVNRKWLMWRAHNVNKKWYAQQVTPAPAAAPIQAGPDALDAALRHPVPAQTVASGQPLAQAASSPGAAVEINTASSIDLQRDLGLDPFTADRIVGTRSRLQGFTSPDQLLSAAGVPPHIYISFRDRIVVTPPRDMASPDGVMGRRLDDL